MNLELKDQDQLMNAGNNASTEISRPSWDEYFLKLAMLASERSTCPRMHCGCVLASDRYVLSTGYNGSLPGTAHCDDIGCLMNILITGGAGFIGSHTADALLAQGHEVRILDNLQKPVHLKGKPVWVPAAAEFMEGDVRDKGNAAVSRLHIPRLVRLPASLSPGQYVAKVTVVDKLGQKVAENRATFKLVARP